MKFLADMGVSQRCVEWLRDQGYDATHLFEQKLHRSSDEEVLCKAREENRILLTMDLDFARLVAKADAYDLPTVVIFRLSDQRLKSVQGRLEVILPIIQNCIGRGSVILSVNDNRVRIRQTPINQE